MSKLRQRNKEARKPPVLTPKEKKAAKKLKKQDTTAPRIIPR
ncbi:MULTISPECIES: hypothetical protein [Thioalkalivibrio]|nr:MULTISPECIES: hypothetical protein [Thioalkalivibrio]PYF99704.1 hypothetical protein D893_02609 [Thioalkalivibrio sp. ALE21]